MTLVIFLLALGAVARVTRFVNDDVLFGPAREWLDERQGSKALGVGTLVHCGWCASIWVAAGVFASAYAFGQDKWWQFIAAALTASYVYAAGSAWIDPEDHEH